MLLAFFLLNILRFICVYYNAMRHRTTATKMNETATTTIYTVEDRAERSVCAGILLAVVAVLAQVQHR